jgi:hypothetical protein
MQSLLAHLSPADIRTDPFPHIVVANPMAEEDYRELCAGYPAYSRIVSARSPDRIPSNRRYAIPADCIIGVPDLPESWQRFAALHSDPAFFAEVAALFDGYWPQALLQTLGGSLSGHTMGRLKLLFADDKYRIHQDARIEINTPVKDVPSSSRGPHLDTLNRIFTCLFYFRHPEDDSVGGDLVLYRWRNGPVAPIDLYALPDEVVEPVLTIPYRANQLVIFPQNIHALHGVSIRHPTPHMRRYVFITAELAENWLSLPASEG